jgi:hypothetical protein
MGGGGALDRGAIVLGGAIVQGTIVRGAIVLDPLSCYMLVMGLRVFNATVIR